MTQEERDKVIDALIILMNATKIIDKMKFKGKNLKKVNSALQTVFVELYKNFVLGHETKVSEIEKTYEGKHVN